MKKVFKKLLRRFICYIYASHYYDFELFIKDAIACGYKIIVREIYYPDYFISSIDGNPGMAFQGGTYYLELKGISPDHFNISCNIILGRFNPLSPLEIEKSRKEIVNRLDSLNLSKIYYL
jgi:hypothetical protein